MTARRLKLLLCLAGSLALVCLTFVQVGEAGAAYSRSSMPAGQSIGITTPAMDATGILDSLRDPARSLPLDRLLLALLVVAVLAPEIGAGVLSRAGRFGLAHARGHGPVRLRGPPSQRAPLYPS